MWGTCNKHSDWDIVIVVHTLDHPKPINTHKGIIEALILSREQFIQSIADHLMQVLLLLWLPKECIWLERFNSKSSFKFNHTTLIKSLEHSRDRDIRIAEKHYMKGDLYKAKKILLHCMRYLELGSQIRENGNVTDYTAAGTHYGAEIYSNTSENWPQLISVVTPHIDQLWTRIISL